MEIVKHLYKALFVSETTKDVPLHNLPLDLCLLRVHSLKRVAKIVIFFCLFLRVAGFFSDDVIHSVNCHTFSNWIRYYSRARFNPSCVAEINLSEGSICKAATYVLYVMVLGKHTGSGLVQLLLPIV